MNICTKMINYWSTTMLRLLMHVTSEDFCQHLFRFHSLNKIRNRTAEKVS